MMHLVVPTPTPTPAPAETSRGPAAPPPEGEAAATAATATELSFAALFAAMVGAPTAHPTEDAPALGTGPEVPAGIEAEDTATPLVGVAPMIERPAQLTAGTVAADNPNPSVGTRSVTTAPTDTTAGPDTTVAADATSRPAAQAATVAAPASTPDPVATEPSPPAGAPPVEPTVPAAGPGAGAPVPVAPSPASPEMTGTAEADVEPLDRAAPGTTADVAPATGSSPAAASADGTGGEPDGQRQASEVGPLAGRHTRESTEPFFVAPPAPPVAAEVTRIATASAPVAPEVSAANDQLVSALAPLRDTEDGAHSISLSLRPATLGGVELDVRVVGGVVHLGIRAEQVQTAALLREAVADLRASLADAGLTTGDLVVTDDRLDRGRADTGTGFGTGADDRSRPEPDARRPSGPAAVDASAATRPTRTDVGLDVLL
jgi:flagellar hook-length control protein FliK